MKQGRMHGIYSSRAIGQGQLCAQNRSDKAEKLNALPTDGRTDGGTDKPTDGPTQFGMESSARD